MFVYFVVGGIFGLPFFYLYQKKAGFIYGLVNILLCALAIILTALLTTLNVGLVILIYLVGFIFLNTMVGLYFVNKANLKDGRGDFLE